MTGKSDGTIPGRRLARRALAITAGLLAVLLLLPGYGAGTVVLAQTASPTPTASGSPSPSGSPTASPSASPTPTGPSIAFLNPRPFDRGYLKPPREPGQIDPPKISDRFDGVDRAYHIVSTVSELPANPIVEAYIQYGTNPEITVGTLDPVPGKPNSYEMYWDIPDSLAEGTATMRVRLYSQTPTGFVEVAADEVVVDMQHKGEAPIVPPDQPADETVEITWPSSGGQLGFYKPRGGLWRTVIDGKASEFTSEVEFWYTTSAPGAVPEYKRCGHTTTFNRAGFGSTPISFQAICALAAADVPSNVLAVAAVAEEGDKPDRSDVFDTDELTQDAADVHVINHYLQDPDLMDIDLEPITLGDYPQLRRKPSGQTTNRCLVYRAIVTDPLQRLVVGANIDVEIQGPNDQVRFGQDSSTSNTQSTQQVPDKGGHSSEAAVDCDNTNNESTQGDHNVPGGPDVKHRESLTGTGLSGGAGAGLGGWTFAIFSPNPGMTSLTAWIDDEDLLVEKEQRPADTDELDPGEAFDTDFAQWYPAAATLSFDPAGGTGPAGSCQRYVLKARAGTDVIPGINVDVHIVGPEDSVDYCDPADATPRRAPDLPASGANQHTAKDGDSATHPNPNGPDTLHTEGETDGEGNFVIGITSPVTGDTSLQAWIDGEVDEDSNFDNDEQGSEPAATASHSWAAATGDAELSFVNPSGYGGGDEELSAKLDANNTYHVVVRVDSPDLVPGVELLYTADGTTFTTLGDMTRVGNSDTYEFFWNMQGATENTTSKLRARIKNTTIVEDRTVTINNAASGTPPDTQGEALEITKPANGATASFSNRKLTIEGTASGGADGLDLFYTKKPAKDTAAGADWISCGNIDLAPGSAPVNFSGVCTLTGADQPSQVTAIAAITFDCTDPVPGANCNPAPGQTPARQGAVDSGDAHRVFGIDANPILQIEPAEAEGTVGDCHRFVLEVSDQNGQPIGNENVDLHITGPGDRPDFCDPAEGGSARSAPGQGDHVTGEDADQGGHASESGPDTQHTEGSLPANGRFVFGISSDQVGDTQILAWLDRTEDDVMGADERSDTALMHWVASGDCTIEGTDDGETIEGTQGDDIICARGGDDIVKGRGGNDIIKGQGGNDILRGGDGDDDLRGGRGKDRLRGGPGTDSCRGGGGRDSAKGCESTRGMAVTRRYE